MRFIVSIILTALLSYALCLFLPWWTIAIAAFVVGVFIVQSPWMSFLSGFASMFLLWGGMSWIISMMNHDILAHRISMLVLKTDSPFLLILMAALIGALVAGFAALAGSYVRNRETATA